MSSKKQAYDNARSAVIRIETQIGTLETAIRESVADYGQHYPGRADHEANLTAARENLTAAKMAADELETPYLEEERETVKGLIETNRKATEAARAEQSAIAARLRDLSADDSNLFGRIVTISTRLQALKGTLRKIDPVV